VDGTWTVDFRNFSRVGPEGYPPDVDARIYKGCKFLEGPGAPYGQLLLGFTDREHPTITLSGAALNGRNRKEWRERLSLYTRVYLRINDQDRCSADNAGSVRIHAVTWLPRGKK
jgi:hypothetical protein